MPLQLGVVTACRTQEDAETQAMALCAILNALKAKRP